MVVGYYENVAGVGVSRETVPGYLNSYIENPKSMSCPQAPNVPSFYERIWTEGHDGPGPVYGQYCLLWGGYTAASMGMKGQMPFVGPRRMYGRPGESRVLLCDYFGFARPPLKASMMPLRFASCHRFEGSGVQEEESPPPFPAVWSRSPDWLTLGESQSLSWGLLGTVRPDDVRIRLLRAATDGSVKAYTGSEVVTRLRALDYEGYMGDWTPVFGFYYLPQK